MTKLISELRARREARSIELSVLIDEIEGRDSNEPTADEGAKLESLKSQLLKLDEHITDLIATETRAAEASRAAAALLPSGTGIQITHNELTYRKGGRNSYFRDLAMVAVRQDHEAAVRLDRHAQEMRDLDRIDGSGGRFVPPLHLVADYAAFARASRVTANLVSGRPLPSGTDSINIPRVTTGTSTAIQTADNALVSDTDIVEAMETAPVRTIAGQQDVAIQLLDQSPIAFDEVVFSDLMADYAQRLDIQVLSGSGASGQVTGIRNVTGINSVTYTDATPTVGELYAKLADAIQQIHTGRFMPPTAMIVHPRRWGWILAALDTSNRPLVVPNAQGPQNAVGAFGASISEGNVGSMLGLPVFVDANLPTNLGAGTNEDVIIVGRMSDGWLFESGIRSRVLPDVLSDRLTVRLQVYGYLAFSGGRYPEAWATVTGTGLVTPTF